MFCCVDKAELFRETQVSRRCIISGAVVMAVILLFSWCCRLRVAAEGPALDNTEQSGDHEKGTRHASNFGRAVWEPVQ